MTKIACHAYSHGSALAVLSITQGKKVYHACSQGSALDEEARARGTSVYLVQRVIPMLPRLLCEKLCSLNSGGAVLLCCAVLCWAVLCCAVTIWLACWTAAGIPTNIFMSHCLPAMSPTACAFCKQGGNTAAASIACSVHARTAFVSLQVMKESHAYIAAVAALRLLPSPCHHSMISASCHDTAVGSLLVRYALLWQALKG